MASQPNPEVLAMEKARRGIQVEQSGASPDGGEEGNALVAMYLEPNFKKYVQENFAVKDASLLENETILQMIYALEWYDVPRSSKPDLIEFHPYLNEDDYEKLYYVKQQHAIELSVSSLLFMMVGNRILRNQGPSLLGKRYVRFPSALILGGLATYALNQVLLKPLLHKDLKEDGLDKYYELDLNADMMKQDLAQLGIRINAAHFDAEQTQKRVNEQNEKRV